MDTNCCRSVFVPKRHAQKEQSRVGRNHRPDEPTGTGARQTPINVCQSTYVSRRMPVDDTGLRQRI